MLARHFRRKTGNGGGLPGSTKSTKNGRGGLENGSSRKTIKFNLDEFDDNDSRESSIRAIGGGGGGSGSLTGSQYDRKQYYRSAGGGIAAAGGGGLATITTLTSSSVTSDSASYEANGDTPTRCTLALHSLAVDNGAYQ